MIPPDTFKNNFVISLKSPKNETNWDSQTFTNCTHTNDDTDKIPSFHRVKINLKKQKLFCDFDRVEVGEEGLGSQGYKVRLAPSTVFLDRVSTG